MKKTLPPLLSAALSAVALLAHHPAGAWGFFGHRTINQVAVYTLPAPMQGFYYRHLPELVRLSTAPDERRNDDPSEAPKHYIDMDYYDDLHPFGKLPRKFDEAAAKFTADTVRKYGTVPWVVLETKDNLVEAFRQRDTVAIVRYSAELGHYIGDAFVPLHTTMNYDGQLTDQKGLHGLWESQLPEKFIADYKLDCAPASVIKDPLAAIWLVVQSSFGFLTETFDRATAIEKTMPPAVRYTFSHRYGKTQRRYSDAFAASYEKAVGGMVSFRLRGAPTMVASFWLTAWEEAGKPDLGAMMVPAKLAKDEKTRLATELEAFKKGTLAQDQLLLAQAKAKKAEAADEIKAAQEMPAAPAEAEAAPVAPAAAPAPEVAPAVTPAAPAEKVKVKTKSADGKVDKQKGKKADGWGGGGW